MSVLLGCIADDFTGGTDLAGILVKQGMRTVQMIGVPETGSFPAETDAVVIALKSRTAPPKDAVNESLAALQWLQKARCRQFYFKYCSTFDSTPQGNIGPVAETLMKALGTEFTIVCPAFPANRRTIYCGYLFVGNLLLNESGMQDHPLTPMSDANLVRVLQAQVQHRVGLVDYGTVSQGANAIAAKLAELQTDGFRFAIVDALSDRDLIELGTATANLPLVTGGSGLALGLPENFRRQKALSRNAHAAELPTVTGSRAVIAGSCSTATHSQVAGMREHHPSFRIDPAEIDGQNLERDALAWAERHLDTGPILIYATSTPEEVRKVQANLGVEKAGELIERTLAAIAQGLVQRGVRQLIIAGGETSGAVVKALGIKGLRIGPEIDPGVPWTVALSSGKSDPPLALALKSGNFGTPDFFLKAWNYLQPNPG